MAVALVIVLNISSCSTYDDGPNFTLKSKKSRLSGTWEVVKVDGDRMEDGSITLEFDKNGDFSFSVEYSFYGYDINADYDGEWEWADGKENIKIDYDEGDDTEFHVTRLTNSEFWFEDEDNIEYECEKD